MWKLCSCCGLWEYHSLEIFLIFCDRPWKLSKFHSLEFLGSFNNTNQCLWVPFYGDLMWFALICYDLLLFSPLSMGARLVSKEWEIEILRWSRLITLNLYRMEPPASTRWGQIATNMPLKNASGQMVKDGKPIKPKSLKNRGVLDHHFLGP